MFENIKTFIKGVINLFKKDDLKRAVGTDIAISQTMLGKLALWDKMYQGKGEWIDNDSVYSLRLEQSIVREFANITLNEMTVKFKNEKLSNIFNEAIEDLNENLQKGLASGAMIIKPLGESKVQYLSQSAFIPVGYDTNKKLIKVIFPETKKLNANNYYTRLEYHELTDKGLTITNTAYHSTLDGVLGNKCSLSDVDEWKNLEESITFPKMTRNAYGYYRNPIANTIDNSACGVSIYDCVINIIKKTDTQFGRLDWEFESGERAIHVDDTALFIDNGKPTLKKLNKRLYRGLNLNSKQGESLFKEFSPTLREQNIIAGLEEYKRNIEFAVGLSYGDISNPQTIEKTATEIKSAKKRKYNTVSSIQKNLKVCLDDLAYSIAFYNSMAKTNYGFVCDFKDSILVDEETERKQDKEDVALGVMNLWEYRMKWFSEDEETAKLKIPEQEIIT